MKGTIYIERHDGPVLTWFKVVRTKNTLVPSVGTELTEAQVKELLDRADCDVIVDVPRPRPHGGR